MANEEAKKRTMQLGETPDSIYVIGSPDLDLMNPESLPSLEEVKEWYQIKYEKYAISMLHPVTTEYNIVPTIAKDYFEALKESEKNYIAIYPNNDLGSEYIVREIEKLEAGGKFRVFRSIRFEYFLRLLYDCEFIIGNSSAGIREAPYYRKKTINVGTRQNNRASIGSIVNCNYSKGNILESIKEVSMNKSEIGIDKEETSNFGDGKSASKFIEIIKEIIEKPPEQQKVFQDM